MIRQNDKRRFGTALENLISNPHTKPTFRQVKRGKKRKKKKGEGITIIRSEPQLVVNQILQQFDPKFRVINF